MKFLLEKVKTLEISCNLNEKTEIQDNRKVVMFDLIMQNKKAHLFHLLPLLSEFITSKDNEIKQIIKDILKLLSIEMGINLTK